MDSLATRLWTGASLVTPSAEIDPAGRYAGAFVRAGDKCWYSKAPPLLPLAASFAYFLLGTLGAYALPAVGAMACFLVAWTIARGLTPGEPDSGGPAAAAIGAVAATPVVVHGALFCGHAIAAALVLSAGAFFMRSCEGGPASTSRSRRRLLAAAVCILFAALAQNETIWFAPATLAAWVILREGRLQIDEFEGARWRVSFLELASGLYVAAALLWVRISGPGSEWGAEWGSAVLIPAAAPAILAFYGWMRLAEETEAPWRGWPRRIWILVVAAGVVVQAAGLRHVLAARSEAHLAADAAAAAAQPGEAILTDSAHASGSVASLATTRAILELAPDAEIEDLPSTLDASGIHAFAAVSSRRSGTGRVETLAELRALQRFLREGEPVRAGEFLVSRFVSGGTGASRPSGPPRGD